MSNCRFRLWLLLTQTVVVLLVVGLISGEQFPCQRLSSSSSSSSSFDLNPGRMLRRMVPANLRNTMYFNNINTYSMLLLHQRLPYSTPQNRYYVAAFAPTVTTIHRIQQHHVDVVSSSIQRQQQRHRMMSTTPNQDGTTTATAPTSSSKEDQLYYDPAIFDDSVTDFQSLGIQSSVLLRRLHQQQLYRPTKVQIAAYPAISGTGISSSTTTSDNDNSDSYGDDSERPPPPPTTHTDVTIACETGSGKTLAYLLPIIDDILQRKSSAAQMSRTDDTSPGKDSSSTATTKFLDVGYDYARAIILVPNKELVQQVVRMAVPLSGGARHAAHSPGVADGFAYNDAPIKSVINLS